MDVFLRPYCLRITSYGNEGKVGDASTGTLLIGVLQEAGNNKTQDTPW